MKVPVCISVCGKYLIGIFFGKLQPDWRNVAGAATAGLGSITVYRLLMGLQLFA